MKPDISELSVEELKRLQEEAEALIASKKIKQSKMLIIKLSRLLKMQVLVLNNFQNLALKKRKKTTRKSVEPRYRNKNNAEETWTGRGKQPRWLVAEIEKGAKLEDFLI